MQQNEIHKFTVTGINNEGEGLVRIGEENFVVFIPDSLPGEIVECRIVTKKKNYAIAKVIKRENESKVRRTPKCNDFYRCGGCQLQHISYDYQLEIKKQTVYDSLTRIAGISEPIVMECEKSPNEWNYRNKASLPVQSFKDDSFKIGFYKTRSHNIVPFSNCPVLLDKLEIKAKNVIKVLRENGYTGVFPFKNNRLQIKHIVIRVTKFSNKSLCAIIGNRELTKDELNMLSNIARKDLNFFDSIIYNTNTSDGNFIWGDKDTQILGDKSIFEKLDTFEFEFEASSFFQINSEQTINLYKEAQKAALSDNPVKILELYSGVGSLTAFLAERGAIVTAVESWEPAAKYSNKNAFNNKQINIKNITGKAEEIILDLKNEKFDVVVLDPPRTGCDMEVINFINIIGPQKIVYVSCNPATLARDIKRLGENYKLEYAKPFDMFPQTCHVETVVLMSRVAPTK